MIPTLEKLLEIKLDKTKLIHKALQHTTYVNENLRLKLSSNERLEFLGDAVLELLVSEFLFAKYPDLPEGKLTMMRAQLVQEESLAYLSRQLKINESIKLGRGEIATGGRERDSILADAYEALLGAIYQDYGLEIARRFVQLTMINQHEYMMSSISQDFKTKFQEIVQQRGAVQISYKVLEQTGPAHDTQFKIGVYIENELVAIGEGRSKKQAEMQAAKKAIDCVDSKGNLIN